MPCKNENCLGIFRNGRSKLSFDGRCNLCVFLNIKNENGKIPFIKSFCVNKSCDNEFDLVNNLNNTIAFNDVSKSFADGYLEGYEDRSSSNFICGPCYQSSLRNFEFLDGKKVYKLVDPEIREAKCSLNLSKYCSKIKYISKNQLSKRNRQDVCNRCEEFFKLLLKRKKNIVDRFKNIANFKCEKCGLSDKPFYMEIDDELFVCSECFDPNSFKINLNIDSDEKIRFVLVNIQLANNESEKEENLQKCLNSFKNDKWKSSFQYVYKDETDVPTNLDDYTFEKYKSDIIYVGASRLGITHWSSSFLRHLNFKSSEYSNNLKKENLKTVLNRNGKLGIFKPFISLSSNSAFFFEKNMIGFGFNHEIEMEKFSNHCVGKNVIVFKSQEIEQQMEDYIFKKSYLNYKDLKSKGQVEIVSLNNLDKIEDIYQNKYVDRF